MLRCVFRLLSLAVLSAVAITTPAAARRQTPGGQPQLSGSARLTGRVVAADTGTPVRLAQVSLSGRPDSQPRTGPHVYVSRQVATDVNGRFDFADLPAGSYRLRVDPVSGFVRLQLAKETTLATGRTVEVTVRVERSGAIEGRIQDENGDGMLAAEVHAVRRITFGSHTTLAATGASATTNDLGEFRLFSLPPGEYYVLATYSRARGYHDPAQRSGYANTYYPGSPALRGARAVVVRAGRNSESVNFTLTRCRLARVSITPVDSRGATHGREAQVALTKRDDVYLRSSTHYTSRREDGTFPFDGIQPGDYYLVVTTGGWTKEAAYVNVSIGEADVSLRVRTNTGAKVSGRVVVDGQRATGGRSANLWVSSTPPPGTVGPFERVPPARVQESGHFELAGLRGPIVLLAGRAGGALLSIRRHGEELAGKTLEFAGTEHFDNVVVELTTQVARVDVTVTSASERGEPEPVVVILFSEDPKRWHHDSIQYDRTTASPVSAAPGALAPARTQMRRMPPGRYLIAAIHDAGLSDPTAVGVLEKLRPLAMPVTLVWGQTTRLTLPVAKAAGMN